MHNENYPCVYFITGSSLELNLGGKKVIFEL